MNCQECSACTPTLLRASKLSVEKGKRNDRTTTSDKALKDLHRHGAVNHRLLHLQHQQQTSVRWHPGKLANSPESLLVMHGVEVLKTLKIEPCPRSNFSAPLKDKRLERARATRRVGQELVLAHAGKQFSPGPLATRSPPFRAIQHQNVHTHLQVGQLCCLF